MTLFDFMSENPFITLFIAAMGLYAVVVSVVVIAGIVTHDRRKP